MNNLVPYAILATQIAHVGDVPTKYIGTYRNVGHDVKLTVMGPVYDLEIGLPLSKTKDKRHVDFEHGLTSFSDGKLTLTCDSVFKSPGRYSLIGLYFGGIHCLFNTLYKTEAQRVDGKKEMDKRLTWGGPARTLNLRLKGSRPAFDLEGVLLSKER